jgi:peptidoglycan/LPS O-acetylase OafA/YrhL
MLSAFLPSSVRSESASASDIPLKRLSGIHPSGSLALDQWRGLALILVLISHGLFFTNRVNGAGRIGVNLFFFISGILSFRSLHDRGGRTGWGQTYSFWYRRLKRLYPALMAFTFIMWIAVIYLQRIPDLPPFSDLASFVRALPWVLTYSINYMPKHPRVLGHLWSLAVEIQFYFIAPLIYLLGGKAKRRQYVVFGCFALLFTALGLLAPIRSANIDAIRYHFQIAVWPMMIGFFCEFSKGSFLKLSAVFVKIAFRVGLLALAVAMVAMPFGFGGKNLVVALGGLLLFPCLLAYLFELPFSGSAGRCLAWCGERTYSIYLWQQPLTLCSFLPNALQPVGALSSIALGACSFHFCEKPFLKKATRVQPGFSSIDPAVNSASPSIPNTAGALATRPSFPTGPAPVASQSPAPVQAMPLPLFPSASAVRFFRSRRLALLSLIQLARVSISPTSPSLRRRVSIIATTGTYRRM